MSIILPNDKIYRPPVAGEPLRLREDGHWSTKGLVGYWPMNEMRGGMVTDYSPQQNHGTLVNGPTWAAGNRGRGAVDFNGALRYASCSNISVAVPFTVVLQLYPTQLPRNAAYADYSTGDNDGWRISSRYGEWRFTYGKVGDYDFNETIVVQQWVSVAITVESVATLYVDGGLRGNTSALGTMRGTPTRLWIGANESFSFPSYATIADFSLYSRALSADEIAALYAAPDLPIWRPRRGISLAMAVDKKYNYTWGSNKDFYLNDYSFEGNTELNNTDLYSEDDPIYKDIILSKK